MKNKKQLVLLTLIVLGLIPLLLPNQKKEMSEVTDSSEYTEEIIKSEEIVETIALKTEAALPEIPVLSQTQTQLLDQLSQYMRLDQFEEASQLLWDREAQIRVMLDNTLEGERYLYNEDGLSKELHGSGLVLTKKTVVFYGDFKDGKPEGLVKALQVLKLDQPRYDYAVGLWHNGTMSGEGRIGYETCLEEYNKVERIGLFVEDLMEGEVTYTTNVDENFYTWSLAVLDGTIQLDERWEFVEAEAKYRLPSQEDPGHVYGVTQDMVDQIKWKNMIFWNK